MSSKKHIKRPLSAVMAALVVFSGAAAFGGVASVDASASQLAVSAGSVVSASYLSSSAITKGGSVTVYGKVSGGTSSSYLYAYYLKKHSSEKWSTIKGFSSAKSVKITPSSATTYDVKVVAKDTSNKTYTSVLTLNVYAPLVNNSKVSKEEIALGSSVTMKGVATGGSGNYEYAFYSKMSGTTQWKTVQTYSTNKFATFKPTLTGNYDLMIKVKNDVGGMVKKTFTLNVVNRLVNTSTISSTAVNVGSSVLLKASATGGIGSYTYAYYSRDKGATTWKTLQSYSKTSTLGVALLNEGKYQFLVKVKDQAGNVSSKIFDAAAVIPGAEAQAAEINSKIIKSGMSDFDKVKAIHDWIVLNTDYDVAGVRSGNVPSTSFTAKGLFDTHVAVCDGYSKAFELMASLAGLEVNRVTGKASSGGKLVSHAWNQVKVDGKWYNIDVTWDDPTTSEGPGDYLNYTYFLVPDSMIDKNHTAESVKNTCTAAQPADKLFPNLIEDEKADGSIVYRCETEAQFKVYVASMSPTKSATYKFIYKTNDGGSAWDLIKANKPNGYYGIKAAWETWKIDGYWIITVTITPC
ncbi:MAG: hypothetical protein IJU51_01320 [Clostridia bacterium]|nr:hypothetical protein [Clostridia bacterium]